jgi:GNAT superfamily N-acetyltransferase
MHIKIAEKNDLEGLFELNKLFGNDNTKEYMERHLVGNNYEIICVAYLENTAVGYCAGSKIKSVCYKNSRLDIEALFVKEEYRHKGVGKALMKFIEKEALLLNIKHFHISTNKEDKNIVDFYSKLDYEITGYQLEKDI